MALCLQLLVEEMNILTTVFLKLDNEKVFYPNSVLATKPISNYYRSPDMGDGIEFSIDFMTPLEKIGAMKEKIKRSAHSYLVHAYVCFFIFHFLWELEFGFTIECNYQRPSIPLALSTFCFSLWFPSIIFLFHCHSLNCERLYNVP